MSRRALICGVSGQDGAYLSQLLLSEGYSVSGTSRDAQLASFASLERLGIRDRVETLSMTLTDLRSVVEVLQRVQPDEVYNLAGQSSVGLSFEQPVETLESIALGTLNLLEAMRLQRRDIRLYNAGSGDCFGDTGASAADEHTPFRPRSPYAVAKAAAFWSVANHREANGLFACSGVLFNHESPLRPARFVTRKIVRGAVEIAEGRASELVLGDLGVERDWGWAPEYVDAMWRMLQQDEPEDLVIATGRSRTLREFVELAFEAVGLEAEPYLRSDPALFRATDIMCSKADPSRAAERLGWSAAVDLEGLVERMVEAERADDGT